ncbi:alpha-amylase [[Emmonsia] crescens]|uniref:Alpha-amylase n=1 Tax=[Emmonsia] crescens TaxID=73230 RepID=A0A2B7ZQ34_9EURO|nr:alpha-amylase [Emmonsia crescens]
MGSFISSAYQYLFRKRDAQWLDIDDFNVDEPGEQNQLMLQAFEWYVPDDQQHWRRLQAALPSLKAIGVTSIWLPPGCKAMSPSGNGYDIYDLYDLGEFYQKGSRATKWGTKEELVSLVNKAHELEIGVIWDTVLNHKAAADHTERCVAVKVDPKDRRKVISEPEEIEAWLGFAFPGRGKKYSRMTYHWYHFTGVDYNARNKKKGIYKILGPDNKDWARDVSKENGNYDYLMFANLDYSHPEVREDVMRWIQWMGGQLPLAGLRLDAVKHYSAGFLKEFIGHVRRTVGPGWLLVAEYWKAEVRELLEYLGRMDYLVSLFDAPLVRRFSDISRTEGADLRKVFEGSLVKYERKHAVTFVMNHDTQPSQSLEEPIEDFFKPLAYSLILLRKEGQPCLFYGDLYGMCGGCEGILKPSCNDRLADLTLARKLYAYGRQRDYFDKRNCIGFVRLGDSAHPDGLACVLSNGPADTKRMYVGKAHAGSVWTEVYGYCRSRVKIDSRGYGVFGVVSRNVSVWVREDAMGRESFGKFDSDIYSYLVNN